MSISDWWEYSLSGAKRNGKLDGGKNIPDKHQKERSAYEQQFSMRTGMSLREISTQWEKLDRGLKGEYVSAVREFIDARKKSEKEGKEAQEALDTYRSAVEKSNDSTDNPHLGRKAYWAIILLIAVGEIPLTAKAFGLMGDSNLMTYIFAIILCVSVPTCAHFAGLMLREKFSWKNMVVLAADLAAFIFVLYGISWVRERYFEAEGKQLLEGVQMDPHMVTLFFFAIQLFIFVVAATASYFAHDGHPDRMPSKRTLDHTAKDNTKETAEAKIAEKRFDDAARRLAEVDAKREKSFASFQQQGERLIDECKMMIQAYRGANIRARGGDAAIASFSTYPELKLPASLLALDRDCGPAVPEASPVSCGICGETSFFSAVRCTKCGNTI